MKPGKTFNLSRSAKTMLANITDPAMRSSWKKNMIQAELFAAVVPKTTKRDAKPGQAYTQTAHGATPTAPSAE